MSAPSKEERAPVLDCGDNSCRFARQRGGMRTNGGCRCLKELDHDPERRREVTAYLLALAYENERLRGDLDAAVSSFNEAADHLNRAQDENERLRAERAECLAMVENYGIPIPSEVRSRLLAKLRGHDKP